MNRDPKAPVIIGRYALYDEIASGGMATVHIGRLLGPVGFSRTVAIKRMHANLAKDPEFVSMFLDEARLAARIRHPNVIGTLDVVALSGELFLVMEYIHGESLFRLMKTARDGGKPIPRPIASAILVGVLDGLHAAHEATNEREEPLAIVHRDVSPHNVIVGASDGLARVLDFGIAKAADRTHSTRDGQIKGKLSYMAPEQLSSGAVDRTSDVYSASVILWEALTGARLFPGESELKSMVMKVLSTEPDPPSRYVPDIPPELEALVMEGLAKDPATRTQTAREMARRLQKVVPVAPASDVAEWVQSMAGTVIGERARRVAIIEQMTPTNVTRPSLPPLASLEARTSSDPVTVTAPSSRRRPLFALAAAVLLGIVVTVVIAMAQGRSAPRAIASAVPASSSAQWAQGATAAPPPVAAEPAAADPTPVAAPHAPPALPPPAPAQTARPSPGAQGAPRKHASGGEFDHVMDSRK
ncbi:MAG TPA: serine/threonine-protein kinase [Polyangiaceae bacterium]|jgi:serine/threonine protein kinase|nr:serine/threonine-protein kinase [Polyangiaceae bacterium]